MTDVHYFHSLTGKEVSKNYLCTPIPLAENGKEICRERDFVRQDTKSEIRISATLFIFFIILAMAIGYKLHGDFNCKESLSSGCIRKIKVSNEQNKEMNASNKNKSTTKK